MARYTEAYSRFIKRLPEVDTLRRLAKQHAQTVGPLKGTKVVNPLCRAGVVLLSSHIEGYVEDLAEIILQKISEHETPKRKLGKRFRYYFSKDLLDEIGDAKDPDKIAAKVEKLFERDKDIWCVGDRFTEELAVDRFVSGFSVPRFEEVQRFIRRFGYSDYRIDLARQLKANYLACTNMVDNVVDQRNKIAHGDAVVAATPSDLANMLKLVRLFCRATDEVVGSWFKSVGCPIR